MATVTNAFNRYARNVTIPLTPVGLIGGAGVPLNTDMTVMGLVVTNTYDDPVDAAITVDVYMKIGAVDYYLIKNTKIPEGESMIVIGWDQKLVLKTGDDIYVETKGTSETADVIMSVLEITTS